MLNKTLATCLLSLVSVTSCESKHESNYYPVDRPFIALNAPTDILGQWKSECLTDEITKTSAVSTYTFNADGTLLFTSVNSKLADCVGESTTLSMKGTYVAGAENELDMSFGMGTVYRAFSVKGPVLLISNNQNAGSDADSRDFDLTTKDVLRLQKLVP